MNDNFFIHQITIYHNSDKSSLDNFQLSNMTVEEVDDLKALRLLNADVDNGEIYIVREIFEKVYFRHNKKSNMIDKGLEKGSSGTIVIPTTDNLNKYISVGDLLIEGKLASPFSDIYDDPTYQKFRVISIDDNRKGNLQHFKLGVSD